MSRSDAPVRAVSTPAAPAAVGPYSQAVTAGGFVFVSGQIPLDPATGQMVTGDIQQLTRRVVDNLRAVLEAAGSSLSRVVKTTIYLTDIGDFPAVNEVYASYFTPPLPARSTVQAAALPRQARVEIDVIALG